MLGIDQVGVDDNFFELGGDSILSIQVITRAREAGLAITPKQLFQNPTIAGLAVLASGHAGEGAHRAGNASRPGRRSVPSSAGSSSRIFPIRTTGTRLFFSRPAIASTRTARRAVRVLVDHHDALEVAVLAGRGRVAAGVRARGRGGAARLPRVRCCRGRGARGWQSSRRSPSCSRACLSRRAPFSGSRTWSAATAEGARLAFIVHHLAVDGVSWRILLEDFERAYLQLDRGEAAALGSKTTSYRRWAKRMIEYAESAAADSERGLLDVGSVGAVARVPLDFQIRASTTRSHPTPSR